MRAVCIATLGLCACGGESDTTASASSAVDSVGASLDTAQSDDVPDGGARATVDGGIEDGATAGRCTFALVKTQTGQGSACAGGNTHMWPIGMAESDCHGWQAVDPSGKTHANSAAAIKCLADGSFTFTQYAGNLTCAGSGVVKTFKAGVCQQDIPPMLHTKVVDLTCCADMSAPGCTKGVPSVTVPGATIFLNGEPCP